MPAWCWPLPTSWPPVRRFLGAPIGRGLVVSSLLFALGHVAVVPNPQRLAVFFPALVFGWMRARTGSIVPGAVFHALCNLFADVLQPAGVALRVAAADRDAQALHAAILQWAVDPRRSPAPAMEPRSGACGTGSSGRPTRR